MRRLSLSTILALGVLAIAGAHHKPVIFFPALFAQEGLGIYGVDVEYLDCLNATDKSLIAPGGQGTVQIAGVCMNDDYVIHLRSGTDAPAGWETIFWNPPGIQVHYRLTPRG